MTMVFDTLKASRQLQDAGFDETQADALVTAFSGSLSGDLVTNAVLQSELQALEQRLTIRMYTLAGAVAAFLTAVISIATGILLAAG